MKTKNKAEVTRGLIASMAIQSRDDCGNLGDFLYSGEDCKAEGARKSPVFSGLVELCTWASRNGWKPVSGRYVYEGKNPVAANTATN